MAEPTEVRFEVHVNDGGRWTVYTDAPTRGRAIQQAQILLGSGKFDAAKVTEERGQSREIVLWHETKQRVQKGETIVPVDDAPLCASVDDFCAFEARLTAGRLLRQFLDNRAATPLELFHDYGLIRELTRNDDLFLQARQNISGILARKSDKKPAQWIDILDDWVAKVSKRAEQVPDLDRHVAAAAQGTGALMQSVAGAVGAGDRDFVARAAFARILRGARDWDGKLTALLDLADKSAGQDGFGLIDEAVAEVLDGSEAMQEVLGYRKHLAAALEVMARVVAGTYKQGGETPTSLERLSAVVAKDILPRTRASITDRIVRSLAGITPLTKGDRAEQQDAFRALAQQMIGSTLFAGSGPLCEAATLRAKSVLKDEFADESSERAIGDMIMLLPTFATKLGYLLDLLGTDFGTKSQDHIITCLASLLASVTSAAQIAAPGASDEHIVRAAAGIRDRLLATNLPQEWRQRFAKRIYDLLITHGQAAAQGAGPGTTAKAAQAIAAKDEAAHARPAGATKPAADGALGKRTLAPGTMIFQEGDAGDNAYLIITGSVDILKRAGGQEIVIGSAGPGNIIGEMALIDSQPRMASARTATETTLNVVPREVIKSRMEKLEKLDPVLHRLMGMFVDRLRDVRIG